MKKTTVISLLLLIVAAMATPVHAVLKEKNLGSTLSILRSELTTAHHEQAARMAGFKSQNENVRNSMFTTLLKSNQNALMLYSQTPDYVFDLAYACHEATQQFQGFKTSAMPFRTYMERLDSELARYDSLINVLGTMPKGQLSEREKTDRNVCLTLAVNIRNNMLENKENLADYMEYYAMTERRLKGLNDYANMRYSEIQNEIFKNSGSNYFSILGSLGSHLTTTAQTVQKKYAPVKKIKSQWDSRMIAGLFVVILFYGIVASVLNIAAMRYLVPKKLRTEQFMAKRTCITMATSTVTFAIIIGIIQHTVNQNFIAMASNLLVEYAWLLGVILISLLLRVDGKQIKSAFRIYSPLIFMSFVVIAFRIILVPNAFVILFFPALLLLCALWQWSVIRRHNDKIPQSDVFFTRISLITFSLSVLFSWNGYTLLSVQMLIWWTMQLTCVLTISCLKGWMDKWAKRHDVSNKTIDKTWIYHLIYSVGLPLMGLSSIWISIYWAADVFNLSELTVRLFTTKFVDVKNFSISMASLVTVVSLWFVFAYISKVSIEFMRLHFEKSNIHTAASRNVMGKNVVQLLVWGTWLLTSLAIMHVSNTWLVVISGGLSTGVGFASKDIIENIYYGVSLMAGRIKIGDWIECDGTRGKVSSISYTSTMIEAVDGSVIAFQNSQLFTKNYKNLTRNHGYELAVVNFGVAYGSNVKEVKTIIEEAVKAMKHPNIDRRKQPKVVCTELGDNSVNFKVLCWVDVTKQAYTEGDIIECVYNTLNEHNIEIPFPQRDIHIVNS